MRHGFIILLIVLSLILSPLTSITTYSETINYQDTLTDYIINTYFTKIILDKNNGGIVKEFDHGAYQISNHRLFVAGKVVQTILHEIIPPVSPMAMAYPGWYPGTIFGARASYTVLEKTPYRLVVSSTMRISGMYEVYLVKKYIFYYDKPYFDMEYVFINNATTDLVMDLSQDSGWLRNVSFSIEISTSFGGDAEDDYQLYTTTKGDFVIKQAYSSSSIEAEEGQVNLIGIVSHQSDYSYPIAVLVLPLNNTISETYGVWFEQAGKDIPGAPVSSTIRVEMKALSLPRGGEKRYNFRVYIGPLIESCVREIGFQNLVTELLGVNVQTPREILGYKPPPNKYYVTLNIQPPDPNTYPEANLSIYRVYENGSTSFSKSVSVDVQSIELDEPGIYLFKIEPTYGFTRGQTHLFTQVLINGVNGENYVAVFNDTSVNITVVTQPIAWIKILVIDENQNPFTIVQTNYLTIKFESTSGVSRVFNISSPEHRLYIPTGTYTVTIEPRIIGDQKISDIYYNDRYVVYEITPNSCRFSINAETPSTDNILIIRYSSTKPAAGGVASSMMIMLLSIVVVVLFVVWFLFVVYRGRRRL